MARDPKVSAGQRLHVAVANYDMAVEAKRTTRDLLDAAILKASIAGMTKVEIAEIVGSSSQRVGQIVAAGLED